MKICCLHGSIVTDERLGWLSLWLISVNPIKVGVVSISPVVVHHFCLSLPRSLVDGSKPHMGLFRSFRVCLLRNRSNKKPHQASIQSSALSLTCNYQRIDCENIFRGVINTLINIIYFYSKRLQLEIKPPNSQTIDKILKKIYYCLYESP